MILKTQGGTSQIDLPVSVSIKTRQVMSGSNDDPFANVGKFASVGSLPALVYDLERFASDLPQLKVDLLRLPTPDLMCVKSKNETMLSLIGRDSDMGLKLRPDAQNCHHD